MIGIYKITCTENNRVYIGSSINVKVRKSTHFGALSLNKHYNERLQNAWNKYGEHTFEFEVLEELSEGISRKEIFVREQYFMDLFKCYTQGFNMSRNAEIPIKEWTKEERLEASIRNKGEGNPFYGKQHSQESINKIINNKPNLQGENNPFYGKTHNQGTKDKIANTKLLRKLEPGYIDPKIGKNLSQDTIESIKNSMSTSVAVIIDSIEYRSKSEAAKALGLYVSDITRRLRSDKYPNYIKKCNDYPEMEYTIN